MKDSLWSASIAIWFGFFVWIAIAAIFPSALLLLIASPIVALWIYARLHEIFHKKLESRWSKNLCGIALSTSIGFSWQLYCRHHANHHRFNNGPGDLSSTRNKSGKHFSGGQYLVRNAWLPYFLHLVPFLSILSIRAESRNIFTWIDESTRVGTRIAAFMLGGVIGGAGFLIFQFFAVNTILGANYLQHFEVEDLSARDWTGKEFARHFRNFGAHEDHHQHPERPNGDLKICSAQTDPLPIFAPRVWIALLNSPATLSSILRRRQKTF